MGRKEEGVIVGAMATAEIPSLDHIHYTAFEHVYEPAEDTWLLCDGLERERSFLVARGAGQVVLELGSGSGCVITCAAMLLNKSGVHCVYFALDINRKALEMTSSTARANHVHVDVACSDLFSGIAADMKLDVLIFNPPYVPTPEEEVGGTGIEASWAGGDRGRVVIDRFLPLLESRLAPAGVCYMILVQENDPDEIISILAGMNMSAGIILTRRAKNELLHVLKIDAPKPGKCT